MKHIKSNLDAIGGKMSLEIIFNSEVKNPPAFQ
jgi:hypothetical protein